MSPVHDYNLANQTPASYRTDHNNLNLAIAGSNASSSGITTTFAHMFYADNSSSGWMRQRNAADSTFNYLWLLGAPGGLATYAGSPSTNHAAKYQGQPLYDTSNNALYIATLAGTSSQATWAQVQFSSSITSGYPKNYMQGLVPTYLTAATFSISAGACRDDSDSANIATSSAYTVNIASAGAGGLSTSETESTSGAWYYCFAIRKSTDGTVNFILTASSSGPVMPSGYNQKRLLPFAIRNTTQADFLKWYVAEGWPDRPKIMYNLPGITYNGASWTGGTASVLSNGTTNTFTSVSCVNFVPPISRQVVLQAALNGSNAMASVGAAGEGANRFTVGQSNSQMDWYLPPVATSTIQAVEYKIIQGSAGLYLDVVGYVVTQV